MREMPRIVGRVHIKIPKLLFIAIALLLESKSTTSFATVRQSFRIQQCTLLHYSSNNAPIDTSSITSNIHRRHLLGGSISILTTLFLPKREAVAVNPDGETKKPFAPVETLLPAVRVKVSIERAIVLTQSIMNESNSNSKSNSKSAALKQLEDILLKPQNYVRTLKLQGVPSKPADLYLESYKPMKGDLPLQSFLISSGDVRTWKQLKKVEKEKERSSEVRAALNAYTDALSFSSESYLLNVDRATRSKMVREDRLPDLKQVITSDMGLRYLYRNQVLTAMDDVKAELEYQLKLSQTKEDGDDASGVKWDDLLELLDLAEKALDRWFSLVDLNDVKEALDLVMREEKGL